MAAEIRVAGFTITRDEWETLDPVTRDELLESASADPAGYDDAAVDPLAAEVLW